MRIADDRDFPKKGRHSVGGKRQYGGELGKIATCQAGVVLAYASPHGATLRDRRLYLPQAGLEDPTVAERRAKCRIPEEVTVPTKNELTLAMVQAVVASQTLRWRWVLAADAFGRDTVRLDAVAGLGLWYMVEVPLESSLWRADGAATTTPQTLCRTLPGSAVTRHRIGDGTKGPRIAEAHVRRVRAQRDGPPGPDVWRILRLDPERGEQKAVLGNAPAPLTVARLATVTGLRWPVEQIFEVAKQPLGMGDYAVRSWPGWQHHMTLVTLAHFFLVRRQCRLQKSPDAAAAAGLPAAQRPVAPASAHA